MRRPIPLIPAVLAALVPAPASAVVVSEIHYHPPAGDEALEFVELANEFSTPEDLSGYAFTEGISFRFAPGTILGARALLVVAFDAAALKARHGIDNVVGNFEGRLDAGGDRLTLVNHAGVVVQTLRYRDRGKWPTGPDGTGHTLVLKHPRLDPKEPESWEQSPELGGSPGKPNFASSVPGFVDQVLIDVGDEWRYRKGTQPFSDPPAAWRGLEFDDAAWTPGPAGIGYGDGDDRTIVADMQNGYLSLAIRKRFVLTAAEIAAAGEFHLGIDYDDGFCAWLNGTEIARSNCGAPGEERAHDAVATGSREAGSEEAHRIPRSLLRAGENVLALVGFNFSLGSTDFSLIPRLLLRRAVNPEAPPAARPHLNELHRSPAPGGGWVEILNPGQAPFDLAGHRLTDDPERPDPHVFAQGASIPAGGFLVVGEAESRLVLSAPEVRLFLLAPGGQCVAASAFDRGPPAGGAGAGYSEARFPDGGPLEWVTSTPTPGGPNQVPATSGIVINEVFYHPPEERAGEFIELYNHSAVPLDLSGFAFDKGISWTIPEGTVLAPGGFLVVAEDPDRLLERYGLAGGVQGPYLGKLANDGENVRLADRSGNPVDEVRYHEGGSWPLWADGRGSSLELVDPFQDNASPAAWEASDETRKAAWEKLAFTVASYVQAAESELHLFLGERGACLIDDVSITRAGGANHIPNPGFESATTAPWTIEGTHIASRRITTDRRSGSACLELSASGKGDTLVNRIEVETAPRLAAGGPYEVSLWARWLRGGSLLVAHGEYSLGSYSFHPSPATNLSGNSLSAGLRLTIPLDLGTPGEENSARRALKARAGNGNLGPTIDGVEHRPPSPLALQPVAVVARIEAYRGVASARVLYRQDGDAGPFAPDVLLDDGLHGDGAAGDALFGGEVAPFAQGTVVHFYIEAADADGALRRFPPEAPAKTLIYQVLGPAGGGMDAARMVLSAQSTQELSARQLHSNDLLPGTFVFNDEEAFYRVGVRYRGSPWGRPGRSNYRVRFENDRPFRRGRTAVNLDNSGGGPNEGAAYFLGSRNSAPGKPAPAGDYGYVRTFLNGGAIGTHGLLQRVDRQFIEAWYGDPQEALAFKVEGRRAFNDGGQLAGWDGATFAYRTENPENYRGYFIPAIRQGLDDWTAIASLTKVMDNRTSSNAAFDAGIDSVLDVEAFLRVLAPRILQADWDAFCIGNGHNGYLVLDPRDGRWELLPFDMDNSFGNPTPALFPGNDTSVARLMSRPWPRRVYYRVLREYIDGYWSEQTAGPYFDALQTATGIGTAGIKGYLATSASQVRAALQGADVPQFRITTNGGNDISTTAKSVTLEGEAPLLVAALAIEKGDGGPEPLVPAWLTPVRWRTVLALAAGENPFVFHGFDKEGEVVGTAEIVVTSSGVPPTLSVTSWEPRSGPAAGGTAVSFQGTGFAAGMKALFGGVESQQVTVGGPESATAVTPPAPSPLPAGGLVDIELWVSASGRLTLRQGFTFVAGKSFLRGDANASGVVEIGDALATLFYLFAGVTVPCLDAADLNDNGRVGLTDVIGTLEYLFRSGPPPKAPFPAPGEDPTEDAFHCS